MYVNALCKLSQVMNSAALLLFFVHETLKIAGWGDKWHPRLDACYLTGFLWRWNKGKVITANYEGRTGDKYCVKQLTSSLEQL